MERSSTIHHEMECHFLHFIRRQLLKRSERKGGILCGGGGAEVGGGSRRKGSTIPGFTEEVWGGGALNKNTRCHCVSEFKCERRR